MVGGNPPSDEEGRGKIELIEKIEGADGVYIRSRLEPIPVIGLDDIGECANLEIILEHHAQHVLGSPF